MRSHSGSLARSSAPRLDGLVALLVLASSDEVKDEDDDDQNSQSSSDGNGDHVVGSLVLIAMNHSSVEIVLSVGGCLEPEILDDENSVSTRRFMLSFATERILHVGSILLGLIVFKLHSRA